MKNIYLPIEVAKREVLPKSFLAGHLAILGYKVYLFEDYIFDLYGYIGTGAYIGKNIFKTLAPNSLEKYNILKKNKIILYYLDEEGGIYSGDIVENWKKSIQTRLEPEILSFSDYYLSWGTWQDSLYRELSKSNVIITGSPNFEICKPEYEESLSNLDAKITNGLKNYILINTRFNLANPAGRLSNLIGPKSLGNSLELLPFLSMDCQYLGLFLKLISDLSAKFARIPIVLRPHPTENADFYKTIFYKKNNVYINSEGHISTWLRNAKVVIHNGCSTAVQAMFADKPVITYMPLQNNDEFDMGLPNKVGYKAINNNNVIELVEKAINSKLLPLVNSDIYNTISNINSFKVISDLIYSNNDLEEEASPIVLKKIQAFVSAKNALKSILGKNSSFDYEEFDRIPSYMACCSEYLSKKFKVNHLAKGLYSVSM